MAEIINLTRSPQDRLQSALRLLTAAQEEQRAAISQFRESLYSLRDTASNLQASVYGLQRNVAKADEELQTARRAVGELQATAARM